MSGRGSVRDATWDVVIVGAGAAGLLAGTFAAEGGARVVVLETRPKPGAKIRVSGGGRCNVLPSEATERDFDTGGSRGALRRILRSWPLGQVHAHFERRLGVALKVESTGKVFPVSDSSREVVDALLVDLRRTGAELRGDSRVTALRRDGDGWRLDLAGGEGLRTRRIVLATGGRSLPRTGSDGAGYGFAGAAGHTVTPVHPALVPLRTGDAAWSALAGVSVAARLEVRRDGKVVARERGDFLFTHRGFSGPVVLDVSRHFTAPGASGRTELTAHWGAGDEGHWDDVLRGGGRATVSSTLRDALPRRLADVLAGRADVDGARRLAELARAERRRLVAELSECRLDVAGDEGWRKAEVTAGGVPLAEVRPDTLESRPAPGLFLAGEILDVTGRLGGYNFLWAWVTGRLAGEGAAAGAARERAA
jgi:predicted Rossmann fold flavoprotein